MNNPKFRAYKPVFGDYDSPVMTEPFTLGDLQDREEFDFTCGSYASWDEFGLEHEDCVVMQYVGIVDSDNKDIYVGDILQNQVDKVLLNWLVCFNGYAFTIKNIGLTPIEATTAFTIEDPLVFIDRKIIGNMYMNPELMISEQ